MAGALPAARSGETTIGSSRVRNLWKRQVCLWLCVAALAGGAGCEEQEGGSREALAARIAATPFPRIGMTWAPVRGDRSLASFARHDLIVVGGDQMGLVPDREPWGLADGFTPESVEAARRWVAEVRRLNPRAVILGDISFYEYGDDALPEDHPWWLRREGERRQFWPGTHRMDWYQPEYRAHVVKQTAAMMATGVDGVFYDNLRQERDPWIAFLTAVRQAIGDQALILANAGYDVGNYDWVAPYLNGIMYESGWSHGRTEWDECIAAMRRTEGLLRQPRISLIERFEDVRDRAGWPDRPGLRQPPQPDPAARRWSLCYALIVGEYYYAFSDNTSHRHDWHPAYDEKIGLPLAAGERLGAHLWRRRYQRALVVVNLPGAAAPAEVVLPAPAHDSLTGERGTRFVVPPGDGRVLVAE